MAKNNSVNPTQHQGVALPWIGLFAAALALSLARATLMGLKDDFHGGGWTSMALWSFARHSLLGLVWCLPLALQLQWGWSLRSPMRMFTRLFSSLIFVGLGYAFIACRIPTSALHTPGFLTDAGREGNAIALLAAICCLAPLAFRRRLARGVLWISSLGICAALVGTYFVYHGGSATWPARPNMILISLDTVRAKELGLYGYAAPTSPELDRFAERCVRFSNAFTPYPWTLLAHGTMLTSLTPSAHGMQADQRLSPSIATLAGRFRLAGYLTAALVDSQATWMKPDFGLEYGFDLYRKTRTNKNRHEITCTLLDELERGPFFLFLHYFDAHGDEQVLPYDATEADKELFTSNYKGDYDGCGSELGCASEYLRNLSLQGKTPSSADIAYIRGLYDAGIRSLDRELGALFSEFERRGLFENSVVVITSDHGENFYEHGIPHHSGFWEESMQVPLLIRTPMTRGAALREEVVGLGDIAPTLLDYANLPMSEMHGTSLRPLVDEEGNFGGPGYTIFDDGRERFGIRTKRWKLVDNRKDKRFLLYDLQKDPAERLNLYGDPALAAVQSRLQADLDREIDEALGFSELHRNGDNQVLLNAEDIGNLQALGYAGYIESE